MTEDTRKYETNLLDLKHFVATDNGDFENVFDGATVSAGLQRMLLFCALINILSMVQ